ncbi:hypothetical protein BH10ACT8_BH10ACT8_02890 [soil metagenome]
MARSAAERNWIAGGAVGSIALAALAWFVVISPQMGTTSDLKNQTADAQSANMILQAKTNKLKADNANIDSLAAELKIARQALPTDSGLPELTVQLSRQAAATGVSVVSITAGQPSVATVAAVGAKPGTSGATAGKLFSIGITLVCEAPAVRQQQFLTAIQTIGPRRVLISAVTFTPSGKSTTSSISASSTMTVTMQAFVSPQSDAAVAALQAQAAAAGAK